MAWPTRSATLGLRKDTNHNGATRLTIVSVPTGKVYLAKFITISVMTGSTRGFAFYIERAGVVYEIWTITVNAGTGALQAVNLALEAGDILTYNNTTAHTGDVAVTVHGAKLG